MLVLSRTIGESIVVPDVELVFTVLDVKGDRVRIGIAAPQEVRIHRQEVWDRIKSLTENPGKCPDSSYVSGTTVVR